MDAVISYDMSDAHLGDFLDGGYWSGRGRFGGQPYRCVTTSPDFLVSFRFVSLVILGSRQVKAAFGCR